MHGAAAMLGSQFSHLSSWTMQFVFHCMGKCGGPRNWGRNEPKINNADDQCHQKDTSAWGFETWNLSADFIAISWSDVVVFVGLMFALAFKSLLLLLLLPLWQLRPITSRITLFTGEGSIKALFFSFLEHHSFSYQAFYWLHLPVIGIPDLDMDTSKNRCCFGWVGYRLRFCIFFTKFIVSLVISCHWSVRRRIFGVFWNRNKSLHETGQDRQAELMKKQKKEKEHPTHSLIALTGGGGDHAKEEKSRKGIVHHFSANV
ncbi:hypothetical protein B0H65DRAFT_253732 [Neurospora tetraspora]|uniref:Uncharacterized protein n=1 Tax=Neurospora tetraspora TaxID=94610 RepID=A0AAE0JAW3_9PEZI|nr:hypothetical protein B0H65DRAFT_253732 [Neurospora tetraspora]